MNYLSVCSGIEAATVAWRPLGWKAAAFSEIEPFPSSVLAHHYPSTPNVGDMTKHKEWAFNEPIDLLVGGTPCQSFSVAGLRKGLEDPRGNLALVYCGILDRFKPKWFVWENVPGVLSSSGGRDFGAFLGAVAQLGYGFAYRVLDAQYFGVAQRRRRVFVVGCLGDWRSAAAVLFERHSLSGNPAPGRKTRQSIASTIGSGAPFSRGAGTPLGGIAAVASGKPTIGTLMANAGAKQWLGNQEALTGDYHILHPVFALAGNTIGRQPENGGNGTRYSEEVGYTLTKTDVHGVVAAFKGGQGAKAGGIGYAEELSPTLSAAGSGSNRTPTVTLPIAWSEELTPTIDCASTMQRGGQGGRHEGVMTQTTQVRRLTPTECERLQGFPDGYTNVPHRGKPTADGPRYKALGNSMAVPCMAWIGERIQLVEMMT